jgi:membrane-associated phospholipid phosphatase
LIAAVYVGYSLVRSVVDGSAQRAEDNAERIVDIERSLGLLHERSIQRFLDDPAVIRPLNTFYALAHFAVTLAILLWLFLGRRTYARWRNTLMATTVLALVGYALFPLMPPRLYAYDGIVDTLVVHGAPWTYGGESVGGLTNQYAAMPSLHVAWALWCSSALWSESRHRVLRVVAVAYSFVAIVAVIATGNHYFLDVVGAVVVLAIGGAAAKLVQRRSGRSEGSPSDEPHAARADSEPPGERTASPPSKTDEPHAARAESEPPGERTASPPSITPGSGGSSGSSGRPTGCVR